MGVFKRALHSRKDNLVVDGGELKIKRSSWSFQYCERPGHSYIHIRTTCTLRFCLPAVKWRQRRTWSILLGSENLNIAINLFACGHFSPDTWSRGCKNSRSRWNVLLQQCPSGNAGCELSHVYRMLSGPHIKMLIIIRVYTWKGLMNAFVQWKEYNLSLINLHSRSRAQHTFQCFVL